MSDEFSGWKKAIGAPSDKAEAITPSDTLDLTNATRGIYVGGSGDITCIMASDSSSVTFSSVNTGSILPIRVKRVESTGTTATNLIALL